MERGIVFLLCKENVIELLRHELLRHFMTFGCETLAKMVKEFWQAGERIGRGTLKQRKAVHQGDLSALDTF